jgi:hypothetical protein
MGSRTPYEVDFDGMNLFKAGDARRRPSMLKYYLYISRTKVDMLFPQIPRDVLAGIEPEVRVNLGLLSGGVKRGRVPPPDELPYRLAVVVAYIRKHEKVGTPANPETWVEAVAPLQFGVVGEHEADIAFFGGLVDDQILALIGSSESIVGGVQTTEAQHAPLYYTLRFLNESLFNDGFRAPDTRQTILGARPDGEANWDQPPSVTWRQAVEIAMQAIPRAPQTMEFLARIIHTEARLVVGTPLYVALS